MDVLSKIETVAFQVLKFLESDAQAGVQEAYPLRLLLKKPVEFTRLMVILKMIHEAIREKKIITKRSIYYSNPNLFKRQSTIDPILSKICHNFDLPRCALNINASSKLVVYGDIVLKTKSENGLAITETIFRTGLDISLSSIDCSAQFVLVVEKDTIFQKLLNESFYEKFKPCLLVTAKGYPDLMSRKFLAQLNHVYPNIPMLGLFDADPHGINVFCTYKYGTMNPTMQDAEGTPVRIPNLRLCGLLPSELSSLQIKETELLPLTNNDKSLLETMRKRTYVQQEWELSKQVKYFLSAEKKAELESLNSISTRFLTDEYLPTKLELWGILPNK